MFPLWKQGNGTFVNGAGEKLVGSQDGPKKGKENPRSVGPIDTPLQRGRTASQLAQKYRLLDQQTDPWGIKVSAVEVKHVDLPDDMQRAMARQAEAEREKRAKIIHAEGEYKASEQLQQAAKVISQQPLAVTLRYLQTLTEIAGEKNSTILFPVPIELLNLLKPTSTDGNDGEQRSD